MGVSIMRRRPSPQRKRALIRHRVPLLSLLLLLVACGNTIQLNSRWRDRELIVDGANQDWGQRRYILEEIPISLGVVNDEGHLYLMMVTTDRMLQMQIAMRGLELWLDPKGGSKHVFGLRLPGAVRDGLHGESPFEDATHWGDARSRIEQGQRAQERRPGLRSPIDPRRLETLFEGLTNSNILVLDSPHDEGWETSAGVADALQVRLAYEAGRLTYEARLPLEYLGHPSYSIDLAAKPRVGVAVRIPKPESLQMQPGLSGRDRRRDGALGTIGGGRGSRGPRSDYVAPSGAIELWAKIHLAPSATSER